MTEAEARAETERLLAVHRRLTDEPPADPLEDCDAVLKFLDEVDRFVRRRLVEGAP